MITVGRFIYEPNEYETEKASNSYLMSVVALIAGLPMPVFNLIATLGFWAANRKSPYFVRWHCNQALLSQVSLLIMNGAGFWWTMNIIFGSATITNNYLAYIATILLYNLAEFIATVYSASKTRKGIHVQWWFYGTLTNLITGKKDKKPSYLKYGDYQESAPNDSTQNSESI